MTIVKQKWTLMGIHHRYARLNLGDVPKIVETCPTAQLLLQSRDLWHGFFFFFLLLREWLRFIRWGDPPSPCSCESAGLLGQRPNVASKPCWSDLRQLKWIPCLKMHLLDRTASHPTTRPTPARVPNSILGDAIAKQLEATLLGLANEKTISWSYLLGNTHCLFEALPNRFDQG